MGILAQNRPPLFERCRGALAAALVLAVLWAVSAEAQQPVVEVAAWRFPPYAYVDERGQLRGRALEAVEKTLTAMGYQPRMVLMPFKRCLASMQDGHMPIMLPCAVSDERSKYMQFSDPIYQITTALWKRGKDLSDCWQDYADLKGLRIGVGLGYSYGEKWEMAVASGTFTLKPAAGSSAELTHFRMAADNRIDMFISDLKVGRYLKEKYAPEFDDIYPCPKKVGSDRPFAAAVSRKYFKDNGLSPDAFLERFNAILKKMAAP